MFPTVTAKVTFQEFSWEDNIAEHRFVIPQNYREDPYRFPDLWYCLELTFIHVLTSLRCFEQQLEHTQQIGGATSPINGVCSGAPYGPIDTLIAMDVPLTNLGDSSAQMTLLF